MKNASVAEPTEKEKQSLKEYATRIACEATKQWNLGCLENYLYYRQRLADLLSENEFLYEHFRVLCEKAAQRELSVSKNEAI